MSFLPEPPHISIFIREKAVGIITAVFHIIKSTAENSSTVTVRCGTGEALYKTPFSAIVTRAHRAHGDAEVSFTGIQLFYLQQKCRITSIT